MTMTGQEWYRAGGKELLEILGLPEDARVISFDLHASVNERVTCTVKYRASVDGEKLTKFLTAKGSEWAWEEQE